MLVYVNGQLLDSSTATVSVWDRGYLYGEGVFTTLRLYSGQAVDGTAHHQRLRRQTNILDLPFTLTEDEMFGALDALVEANDLDKIDSRARITISRNGNQETPLLASNMDDSKSNILITTAPLPEALPTWHREGIAVITLGPAFVRGNLPHLKTLNSLPTLMGLRHAHAKGCPEALLINRDGNLLEGILSNVFLVIRGKLMTPAANGSILAGRTRERVISSAIDLGMEVDEKPLQRGHLNSTQEIFMTNAIREIVPVVLVDGRPVGSGLPGPVTRLLQDQYRSDINSGQN